MMEGVYGGLDTQPAIFKQPFEHLNVGSEVETSRSVNSQKKMNYMPPVNQFH